MQRKMLHGLIGQDKQDKLLRVVMNGKEVNVILMLLVTRIIHHI